MKFKVIGLFMTKQSYVHFKMYIKMNNIYKFNLDIMRQICQDSHKINDDLINRSSPMSKQE